MLVAGPSSCLAFPRRPATSATRVALVAGLSSPHPRQLGRARREVLCRLGPFPDGRRRVQLESRSLRAFIPPTPDSCLDECAPPFRPQPTTSAAVRSTAGRLGRRSLRGPGCRRPSACAVDVAPRLLRGPLRLESRSLRALSSCLGPGRRRARLESHSLRALPPARWARSSDTWI